MPACVFNITRRRKQKEKKKKKNTKTQQSCSQKFPSCWCVSVSILNIRGGKKCQENQWGRLSEVSQRVCVCLFCSNRHSERQSAISPPAISVSVFKGADSPDLRMKGTQCARQAGTLKWGQGIHCCCSFAWSRLSMLMLAPLKVRTKFRSWTKGTCLSDRGLLVLLWRSHVSKDTRLELLLSQLMLGLVCIIYKSVPEFLTTGSPPPPPPLYRNKKRLPAPTFFQHIFLLWQNFCHDKYL